MLEKHKRTLILNADHSPIGLVSWKKAVIMDWKGSIVTIDFFKDDFIQCPNDVKLPIPAVAALKKYSNKPKKIKFCRKYLFLRDKMTCQYCHKKFRADELTYDHVIPRARFPKERGTPTHWENIVACCHPCNKKKGDKSLAEAKMTLLRKPVKPNSNLFILGLAPWTTICPEWRPYLTSLYTDLHNK